MGNAGGNKGFEEGLLGGGERTVGGDEESGGEVVVEDESLGELGQWDEVTHSGSRKNDYVWWWLFRH